MNVVYDYIFISKDIHICSIKAPNETSLNRTFFWERVFSVFSSFFFNAMPKVISVNDE